MYRCLDRQWWGMPLSGTLHLKHLPVWLMLTTICSMLPQVFASLGVGCDRYDRKLLIMISDAFIAVSTLGLAIAFWLGFTRIELLLVVSVVQLLAGIQMPAVNAPTQLVPPENLTRAGHQSVV